MERGPWWAEPLEYYSVFKELSEYILDSGVLEG